MAELVAQTMARFGKPNASFPNDRDMTFGELQQRLEGKVNGLGALLKVPFSFRSSAFVLFLLCLLLCSFFFFFFFNVLWDRT